MNQYEDAHCHLQTLPREVRLRYVEASARAGVSGHHCCGTRVADWAEVIACGKLPGVRISFGVHPWHCSGDPVENGAALERLEELLKEFPDAGAGEIGLDGTRPHFEAQRRMFRAQLEIAARLGRAVSLHCVRAQQAILEDLAPIAGSLPRIYVHGFLEGAQFGRKLLSLGPVVFGIGPRLFAHSQFRRGAETGAFLFHLPPEKVALETDFSWNGMPPEPRVSELPEVARKYFFKGELTSGETYDSISNVSSQLLARGTTNGTGLPSRVDDRSSPTI